jgi:hypothetical protein
MVPNVQAASLAGRGCVARLKQVDEHDLETMLINGKNVNIDA